jgi:hypothetical protein
MIGQKHGEEIYVIERFVVGVYGRELFIFAGIRER